MATDGKWRKLRGKLPAFVKQENGWSEKVDAAKEQYAALELAELGREFKLQTAKKKEHEAAVRVQNVELEAISLLLLERMEGSGAELVQLASGGTVYINDEPCATVEDRKKVMAWIKANKAAYLLAIQYQTLNALSKERIAAGKPPLPGVKLFIKTTARLRGLKDTDEDAKD